MLRLLNLREMKTHSMRRLMEDNAVVLRRLHQNVKNSHQRLQEDGGVAWQQAVAAYNGQYDTLAFPGGLSQALDKLQMGDPQTAETALIFLEVHPYFFRSQYHFKKIVQLLKKLHLRPDLQQRFEVVLAAAHQRKRWRRTGA
jgi:hypothetical protein